MVTKQVSNMETGVGSGTSPEISKNKNSKRHGAVRDERDGPGTASGTAKEIIGLQLRMRSLYHTPPDVFMNIIATSGITLGLSGDLCHPIADDFVQVFSKWASAYGLEVEIETSPDLFNSEEDDSRA